MSSVQPPRLATWMMTRFGCSPRNEAVLGDLAEQYRRRPSRSWYWRQVLVGISVSFFRETWGNKLRAIWALVAGWVVWISFALLIHHFGSFLFGIDDAKTPLLLGGAVPLADPFSGIFFVSCALIFGAGVTSGLVVRNQLKAGVPIYAASVLVIDCLLMEFAVGFGVTLVAYMIASVLGVFFGAGLSGIAFRRNKQPPQESLSS
jgi:hypothetical protein